LAIHADTRFRGNLAIDGAVSVAPCAHDVEVLEREAGRIAAVVADGAAPVPPMGFELLTNGYRAANVRFDAGDWRLFGESVRGALSNTNQQLDSLSKLPLDCGGRSVGGSPRDPGAGRSPAAEEQSGNDGRASNGRGSNSGSTARSEGRGSNS
jgi:hypothetical protein